MMKVYRLTKVLKHALNFSRSHFAPAPSAATEKSVPMSHQRRFRVLLIKPSHYDDDGYIIRWYRNIMPSNSLAAVYAIADDTARRNVLGNDVEISVTAIDETNQRVNIDHIIADFRRDGNFGLVGLVGVQSNQYPRALDIARPLCAAGIPVVIGGFHVSGMLAMFPEVMPDLQEALDMSASLFSGEAEGRFDDLILHAAAKRLKPIYNFVNDLPALEGSITPFLTSDIIGRTIGKVTSGSGLPLSMFVLHDHQRAGSQIAQTNAGRHRANHPP